MVVASSGLATLFHFPMHYYEEDTMRERWRHDARAFETRCASVGDTMRERWRHDARAFETLALEFGYCVA
jgi:hypothetical protein